MIQIKNIFILLVLSFAFMQCTDDLNQVPDDSRSAGEDAFIENPMQAYSQLLAKTYGSFILTGNQGPAGQGDLDFPDEGFTSYIRQYFKLQEWSTDEAICAWQDPGIPQINNNQWGASNSLVSMIYSRIFFSASLANDFLRQSTDAKLDRFGVSGTDRELVMQYRAEARLLRALAYYHALDMFGNIAPVFETDPVGFFLPARMSRTELFEYVESELLAIEDQLAPATTGPGQTINADQGVAWMLLAKLYLNAEAYTQTAKYTDCMTYLEKIIQSNVYSLSPDYQALFLADNGETVEATSEMIFALYSDGDNSQSFGGTTFIINASLGDPVSDQVAREEYGTSGRWFGHRARKTLVEKFEDPSGSTDVRAIFGTDEDGYLLEIEDPATYQQGYGVLKYKNVDINGSAENSNVAGGLSSVDFPMFRLADVYLMYAEAHLRGGGGTQANAIQYINELRQRAYGDATGNIIANELTLDFIINERSRELYWEGHRRQDLIRFGLYTGSTYVWPWKGGSSSGASIADFRSLYPIPTDDMSANPNLVQNIGY